MKRLKLTAIVACLILITVLMNGQTLAYFSTVGRSTNVITTGNIRMMIREKTEDGSDFPSDGVYVAPGDVVSKIVSVENTCEHPFYLKIRIGDAEGEEKLFSDGCLKIDVNERDWSFIDGFYYFI